MFFYLLTVADAILHAQRLTHPEVGATKTWHNFYSSVLGSCGSMLTFRYILATRGNIIIKDITASAVIHILTVSSQLTLE